MKQTHFSFWCQLPGGRLYVHSGELGTRISLPVHCREICQHQRQPFNIFPNPELESETGWSAELSRFETGTADIRWQAYVDASVFMQRYFNMMEFTFGYYPSPGVIFPYGFKSLNIGNTEIRGGEVSVSGAGKFGRFPLSVLAGYTYIDPVFQDFDNLTDANSTADYNILKYRFKHVVKFDAESSFEHFRPGIEVQYNSYMEAIDQVFLSFIAGLEEYRAANDHGKRWSVSVSPGS